MFQFCREIPLRKKSPSSLWSHTSFIILNPHTQVIHLNYLKSTKTPFQVTFRTKIRKILNQRHWPTRVREHGCQCWPFEILQLFSSPKITNMLYVRQQDRPCCTSEFLLKVLDNATRSISANTGARLLHGYFTNSFPRNSSSLHFLIQS